MLDLLGELETPTPRYLLFERNPLSKPVHTENFEGTLQHYTTPTPFGLLLTPLPLDSESWAASLQSHLGSQPTTMLDRGIRTITAAAIMVEGGATTGMATHATQMRSWAPWRLLLEGKIPRRTLWDL